MQTADLESLTPSERNILRELLRERDQKAVARNLGLSPETVKTHLKNAREKCGADTSFALAKAFAHYEGAPPQWGITSQGGEALPPGQAIDREPEQKDRSLEDHSQVREVRTPFVFDQVVPLIPAQPLRGAEGTGLRRMLMIAVLTCLLIFVIVLAFPLSESFQRLANVIDPPSD